MTRYQLDLIPDRLLTGRDTARLIEWLGARGWRMSLAELEAERHARSLTNGHRPPQRKEGTSQ